MAAYVNSCDTRSARVDLKIVSRNWSGIEVYIVGRSGTSRRLGVFNHGTSHKTLSRGELDSGSRFLLRVSRGGMGRGTVQVRAGAVMCEVATLEIAPNVISSMFAGADIYPATPARPAWT